VQQRLKKPLHCTSHTAPKPSAAEVQLQSLHFALRGGLSVVTEHPAVVSCLITRLMAIQRLVFNRTSIDHITEELVIALSDGESIEFKDLFTKVYRELKRKKAASGSEEVLRLRCYDRLLKLAGSGLVEKKGKTFRALPGIEQASSNGPVDVA
jgi:hypothetical protein